MARSYTCAECGDTFEAEWSEDEAHAERERNFPGMPLEQMAVVCDACYKQVMADNEHEIL